MKKIVFLTRSYYPNIGGVEKHIYHLSKVLAEKGSKVTIVTEDSLHNLPTDFEYELRGVKVIRIPVGQDDWFKKLRIWKWIWKNKDLFLKSDITHCHDVYFWYLPLALIYPLKSVYTTFHGYESYPIKLKAILYRKVFEYMSNRTICVGDFMRKWYHAHPTIVIYGGVELPSKNSKPKKNTAIFIGRLDEHTGISVYAEAVTLIRKKIPSFTLTVYGDGPLKDKIKREGIIVKGFDPDADKEIQKYEYAFISRYLGILEAMAAKRLVFAHYDNPVKEDYLKMTPYKDWIIPFESAPQLSTKILSSTDYSKRIDFAYSWVKDQSWEKVTTVYLDLWKNKPYRQ